MVLSLPHTRLLHNGGAYIFPENLISDLAMDCCYSCYEGSEAQHDQSEAPFLSERHDEGDKEAGVELDEDG